jgi:hypothetical protein
MQKLPQNVKFSKLLVDSAISALDSEDADKKYVITVGFATTPQVGKDLNQVKTVLNKFRAALSNFSEDLQLKDMILGVTLDTVDFDRRLQTNTHNLLEEKAGLNQDEEKAEQTDKADKSKETPEPPEAA